MLCFILFSVTRYFEVKMLDTLRNLKNLENVGKSSKFLELVTSSLSQCLVTYLELILFALYIRIWVVVRGDHFSWKEKDTMRSPIRRTRKKQREIVPVKSLVVSRMQGIEPVMTGKSDRKFRFVAHEAKHGPMGREYVWKCATVEERNRWVATLRKVHLRNNCS